jgi:SAM-dependent methyltransferase
VAALDAIDAPRSASALALAYRAGHRARPAEAARALLPAFGAVAASGAADWLLDSGPGVAGLDVLELGGGPSLRGLACRALGAKSYALADRGAHAGQRTVRGQTPGQRVRLKEPLSVVAELDGSIRFSERASDLADASFDLAILHPEDEEAFRAALGDARRLLRPGGALHVEYPNPVAWRAHGLPPQSPADYDPEDREQRGRADWNHAARAARRHMRLAAVEEAVRDAGFDGVEATRTLDDPEIIARLTGKIRRGLPDFTAHELLTAKLVVRAVARAPAEERAGRTSRRRAAA